MTVSRRWLCSTSSLAALAAFAATASTAAIAAPQRRTSTVIVALRAGSSPGHLPGVRSARLLDRAINAYALTVDRSELRQLEGRADVLQLQSDYEIRGAAETTACTQVPSQRDYLLRTIDAADLQPPATTPPIAVLDSGLDTSLPQFAGRVVSAENVLAHNRDVTDTDGHGTAVAGVAAAGVGFAQGVSPTSPIMPIKLLQPDGTTTAAAVVAALGAASSAGAGVVNISGAGPMAGVPASDNQVVSMAIDALFSRGITIVAASGNEGSTAPDVPASYPHVLSVGAIGATGRVATFSNGGRTLDLVAPGVQLTEPAPSGVCASGYQLVDGTSFAAPAVSGASALLEALRPSLTPSQRFDVLRTSARAIASRWNPFTGFGVLDVAAALSAPAPPRESQPEVNDDIYWVTGRYATVHPELLRGRTRRASVSGTLDSLKDPTDVYRVRLRRAKQVHMTVTTSAGVQAQVGVWDPKTGSFDISRGNLRHRVAASRGSVRIVVNARATHTGTYFVSVTGTRTVVGGSTYQLSLNGG